MTQITMTATESPVCDVWKKTHTPESVWRWLWAKVQLCFFNISCKDENPTYLVCECVRDFSVSHLCAVGDSHLFIYIYKHVSTHYSGACFGICGFFLLNCFQFLQLPAVYIIIIILLADGWWCWVVFLFCFLRCVANCSNGSTEHVTGQQYYPEPHGHGATATIV